MPLSPFGFPNANEEECITPPGENPLETGILRLGDVYDSNAWSDSSLGVSYGDGRRYEYTETPFMKKVPSKHARD